ncbi:ATP-binding protein [Lentzea sp. BCCO 10_0856]|uniref:ATP-binding protein n=1 Tax=Lentzea miocenica TaxID=3095431 RepID=A0ABU4T0R3_9PSEU|nr:ATP-binding protein [Lentzea sp. BCCO 10_0856]MDX8031739.1 ATP-binding protein [Lentzea sp. BCCO 10_0856]
MSGELGLAGYVFQYHVIVLTALEVWSGETDSGAASILVEGLAGADKVDYALVGKATDQDVVVQVKSRWNTRPWSAQEMLKILIDLDAGTDRVTRLELVTNGRLSERAQRFSEVLEAATRLSDAEFAHELREMNLATDPSVDLVAVLRRATITVRPSSLPQLREQVRTRLRRLRAASGSGIGDHAAELLRAYLLALAMAKTESDDPVSRTLTREEFLDAVAAPQPVLEQALRSRWGVPVGLANRDLAVRRDTLLAELGEQVRDHDGVHATDGRVRSCVLVGPAGVGKTTLAQQYALDNAAEFDWIYQLTAHTDDQEATDTEVLREELEQLARWLPSQGINVRSGPYATSDDVTTAVTQALASCARSWLLIIDNASAADSITPLLPASGHGVVLITSRNSAWHGMQSLVRVGELTEAQACDLVHRRLGNHVAAAPAEITTLCRELEFLPLSLVTAASYLRSTSEPVHEFLESLGNEVLRLEALDFPLQRLDDYPRTAVAAVNLALRHLHGADNDHHYAEDALAVLRRASLVFPDRIPTTLLADDRRGLSRALAVLKEFSLLTRWQDNEARDWARVHRLVQDVVRAGLDTHPEQRDQLLRDMEHALVDLLVDNTSVSFDLVVAGAARLHAATLVEHLRRHELHSWQTTTALLSNMASVARVQGDIVEAERRVREALELVPDDNYDPMIAGRRGMTLITLSHVLLSNQDLDGARRVLDEASRLHDAYRFNEAHAEALVCCKAQLSQIEAARTLDQHRLRTLFQLVQDLPEIGRDAAAARAEALVKIGRQLDRNDQSRSALMDSAEHLLQLAGRPEHKTPLGVVLAHLCLTEAHAADHGTEAAWRHYQYAMSVQESIEAIDPGTTIDEVFDLVLGLFKLLNDVDSELPVPCIDALIERILGDIQSRLAVIELARVQREHLELMFHAVSASFAGFRGDVDNYDRLLDSARRLEQSLSSPAPSNVEAVLSMLPHFRYHALLTNIRMNGPAVNVHVVRKGGWKPSRPLRVPTPCRHFDRASEPIGNARTRSETSAGKEEHQVLVVDHKRAVVLHLELLTLRERTAGDDEYELPILQAICRDVDSMINHVVGAWNIITNLRHFMAEVNGCSPEQILGLLNRDLVRLHHDEHVDTVPARAILKTLGEGDEEVFRELIHAMPYSVRFNMFDCLLYVERGMVRKAASVRQCDVVVVLQKWKEDLLA